MLRYDLDLALRSLRRTPVLSGLMIATIAVGIATFMIAATLYHARAGHPIPWKEDRLFAVALDTRDAGPLPPYAPHPEYPPFQLTYRDAEALYQSKIPARSAMMYRAGGVITPEQRATRPFDTLIRMTTADFFGLFDVPFLYGAGWSRQDDVGPQAMVVISKYLNERVFGGRNSVGRSLVIDGRSYRVMGVLGAWLPQPRFYDLNGAGLDLPEDVYMPFGWGRALKMQSTGSLSCNQKARVTSFDSVFTEECLWLQYWVELPNAEARERYSAFVDSYVRDEKAHGRFPRPLNNRIASVATWLDMHDVVGEDSRMQLALAVMFLAVCILNTLGLVLAKFLSAAPISGLRRALGATRVDVIRQHLTEMVLVGALGGAAGLLLTLGGLAVLRGLLFRPLLAASNNPATVTLAQSLVHMDVTMLTAAVVVSVLTGVLAGLYPAWRIGRLAPNTFLKAQ